MSKGDEIHEDVSRESKNNRNEEEKPEGGELMLREMMLSSGSVRRG